MTILLALAILATPIVHRGESISLELHGLDAPHIAWLRASLVSNCDSEYVLESGSSRRVHGAYYADFLIPDDAEPCLFTVKEVEYEVYGEEYTHDLELTGPAIEVQK